MFKRLLLSTVFGTLSFAAWAQAVGPPNAILCNKTATSSAGAATTRLVAAIAGQTTHICGYDVGSGAAAGGFQLEFGTGTGCSTPTTMTAAYTLGINSFVSSRSPFAQMDAGVGTDVCVVTTGTGPTAMTLYYSQF
jgi:hypothetical protein